MELKARKMDLVEALMQLDNEKLAKAEKYIKKLLSDSPTKKMCIRDRHKIPFQALIPDPH